ncbi:MULTISPECIES: SDR family oxidoreductase [unclassified Frankia]
MTAKQNLAIACADHLPGGSPCAHLPQLAGRGALVTGASSGIGRAVALRLARAGALVIATGRDQEVLARMVKEADEVGLTIHHQAADITDPADRGCLVDMVRDQPTDLKILVHSAGAYHRGAITDAPLADLDEQLDVNVRAPYVLTQMLIPDLIRTGGDVVFINSTQGLSAGAGAGQYAAAKHALRAIADSLRAEVSAAGVRVCTVFPGRTATPMQQKIFQAEGRAWNADLLIAPDDIADAVTGAVALPDRASITEIVMRPTHGPGPRDSFVARPQTS